MTRLSNRQYPMLATFATARSDFRMKINDAQLFDQRPFRSMLIQKWITYETGSGFLITEKGREAWREFQNTDIARKDPTMPLTAYFDPTAYALKGRKRRLHVIRNGKAA